MLLDDQVTTDEFPVLAALPGRMHAYQRLSGPCLVYEGRNWRMRCGTFASDEEAAQEAAKSHKKRKDGTKVRAGRWEEMYS